MPIADLAFFLIGRDPFLGNKRRIMNFSYRSGPVPNEVQRSEFQSVANSALREKIADLRLYQRSSRGLSSNALT